MCICVFSTHGNWHQIINIAGDARLMSIRRQLEKLLKEWEGRRNRIKRRRKIERRRHK